MKFDLLLDGRLYKIEVGTTGDLAVRIDGETYRATLLKEEGQLKVTVGDRDFLIRFDGVGVSVNGERHRVEVRNLRRGGAAWANTIEKEGGEGKPTGSAGDENTISPPMPGRIVSIKVKEGEAITVGSPILVLEAMKMQNEIVSSVDGTVREIRVSEGDLVESGEVIVVIGK